MDYLKPNEIDRIVFHSRIISYFRFFYSPLFLRLARVDHVHVLVIAQDVLGVLHFRIVGENFGAAT